MEKQNPNIPIAAAVLLVVVWLLEVYHALTDAAVFVLQYAINGRYVGWRWACRVTVLVVSALIVGGVFAMLYAVGC